MTTESLLLTGAFLLVAAGGTAVVLTRDPRRQVITYSIYGMLLTILFMTLQAPDVALSELAVGTAALPLMLLVTLGVLAKPNSSAAPRGDDRK